MTMITRNLITEQTVPLKHGIDANELPEHIPRNTYYKHKDVNECKRFIYSW